MALPPEEMTYYEQWGLIKRRVRHAIDTASRLWVKSPTLLVECKWRLGDEIMASALYPVLAQQGMALAVLCNYPELLVDNPHVGTVNDSKVKPQGYLNLRGVPRDQNRAQFYRAQHDLRSKLNHPRLYYTDWSTPLLDEIPIGDGPVVALCRGASWTTKRWTVDRWTELGLALESRGYRVIVLGQAGETIPVGTDFTGRTGVRDAACLLRRADVTISNDSGLMHLSLAADTQTIGLFGPTDPAILIEDGTRFHPLTNERECQGCWNRDLSIQEPGVCPKGIADCMETISVEEVLAETDRIIGAAK